jgi:hypothetical protein
LRLVKPLLPAASADLADSGLGRSTSVSPGQRFDIASGGVQGYLDGASVS